MKKQKVNGNFVSFNKICDGILALTHDDAIDSWNHFNKILCHDPNWQVYSPYILDQIELKRVQQDAEFRESLLNNQKTTHIHPQPGSTVNMNCHQQNTNLAIDPQKYTPEQINYLLNHSKL